MADGHPVLMKEAGIETEKRRPENACGRLDERGHG
jgi:hypothetical protein